ncbi:sortase [bacterium]|nr:sortase [bacterium]
MRRRSESKMLADRSVKKIKWPLYLTMLLGAVLMVTASLPFLQGWWQNWLDVQAESIVYPVEIDEFLSKLESNPKILADFNSVTTRDPLIVDEIDYGNIENWFSNGKFHAQKQTSQSYRLDIDKLNIHNALVKVGGTNIDYNLVQFNTDVAIGDYGAPVIFGHSMLRQFYNPKESNKERYKGLFSTIMTLEPGDEIQVTIAEVTYTFLVTDLQVVQPDDDFIMSQDKSKKQIKLVTCTPEGTRLRRGVVTAELKV